MKRSISKKFLIGLVMFTIVLSVCLASLISTYLRKRMIREYEYLGTAITETIAYRLDGDKIQEYLQTKQPDAYYNNVMEEINVFDERFGTLYMYIAIPEEEKLCYIWANGFTGEETLGFEAEYTPGGKDWMQGKMEGKEEDTLCFVHDPKFGSIATAATPVFNSGGEAVALVLADFSLNEIKSSIRQIIVRIVLYFSFLMAIYILIYNKFVNAQIVRPIQKLTEVAKNMTGHLENETEYKLDIHTGDELETLSDAFQKMNIELRDYIADNLRITAEKERLGTELDMAAEIQENQLPNVFPAFPERSEFEIYASMKPAKSVGGDFYDFYMVDDDHLALVIADVSGKGVPAALFMMISRILIKNHMKAGERPAEALTNVNRQLVENNDAMQFVTVWLAVLELSTGKGIAANAGHEHPALRRRDGTYKLVEYTHSPVVGVMEEMKYADHEFVLCPGDSLFVYTDGVAEAMNSDYELFDTDRMLDALNRKPDAAPKDTLKNVLQGIQDFVGDAEQFDDITMLNVQFFGRNDKNSDREDRTQDAEAI